MRKKFLKNLPLFFLATAISFSPSFFGGTITGGRIIEIRIEDILIVILGLVWLANFLISGKKKVERPPLFFPILVWLGIGCFSILTNWLFANIAISRGFFYFLKEVEFFFLYFYLFYHIRNLDSVKFIINSWIVLGILNVILISYQFIAGYEYGYYGPGLFKEEGVVNSGGFFLILFVALFNIFLYYHSCLNISKIKKTILMLSISSLIIGIIASGSVTCVLGGMFASFLTIFLYQLKRVKQRRVLKPIFISLIALIVFGGIFFGFSGKAPRPTFGALSVLRPGETWAAIDIGRAFIWRNNLALFKDYNPLYVFFGLGKSVSLSGEECHNQYVRNFIETGIIGSMMFFILILVIIKKALQGYLLGKTPILIGLSTGLLVTTLTMLFISIASDAFLVVRVAEIYWFFTALTMAVFAFNKRKENYVRQH